VTRIADSAAGLIMSHEIDLVIVMPTAAANGDTATKSEPILAVMAQRHGVLSSPPDIHPRPEAGARQADPDRGAREDEVTGLLARAGRRRNRRNPAFDVTPAGLVTALITERGIVQRPDRAQIRALLL
jgi:methylthioribose-1-phosphate isomerase